MNLGFTGRDIGARLNLLLSLVLDEQVPNERNALLAAIHKEMPEDPSGLSDI